MKKKHIKYIANNSQEDISIKELGIHTKFLELTDIVDELTAILYEKNRYMKE